MENLLSKKGLNTSLRGKLAVLAFLISTLLLILSIIYFIDNKAENYSVESKEFLLMIFMMLLVFIFLINGQEVFNNRPNQSLLRKITNQNKSPEVVAEFYKKRGFKRILIYFPQTLFYLAVISYLSFALKSEHEGKGLFVFILFWIVITIILCISMYRRYMLLSLFIVIYKDAFVLRNNLTTYYFPASSVKKIEYILISGRFKYIVFVSEDSTRIKIDLTYFRNPEKNEIKDQLSKFNRIEKLTKKVQRRSRPGSVNY